MKDVNEFRDAAMRALEAVEGVAEVHAVRSAGGGVNAVIGVELDNGVALFMEIHPSV